MPINEPSLKMVFDKAEELAEGILPDSTPKAFLEPALVQMTNIPTQRNCTLLIYDTGGESFENPSQLPQNAPFLKRAKTVMFLVSIPDLDRPRTEMAGLLEKYVLGMRNHLQASTKDQHLVVVYTKADRIDFRNGWQDLEAYLKQYNTKRPHRGRGMEGRTPHQVFKAGLKEAKKAARMREKQEEKEAA